MTLECSPLLAWVVVALVGAAVVNACLRVYLGTRRWWSEFKTVRDPVIPEIVTLPNGREQSWCCPRCQQMFYDPHAQTIGLIPDPPESGANLDVGRAPGNVRHLEDPDVQRGRK